jgi:hypothetical protein
MVFIGILKWNSKLLLDGVDVNLINSLTLLKYGLLDFVDKLFLIEDFGMSLFAVLVEVGYEVLDVLLNLFVDLLLLWVHGLVL